MKQFAIAVGMFVCGFVLGTAGSDESCIQNAYVKGQAAATLELQQAAIREGHAIWLRRGDGQTINDFTWLPRHTHWEGDRPSGEIEEVSFKP